MRRLDVLPAARRRARAGIVLALITALLCWPVAVVALTANLTVQRADYYRQAVDETDVYRRLYDEVLADPAVAGVTRDLLAGLPVPAGVVVDNLRLVAPAPAVRGAVNTLSTQISGYLGGQRPTLTLSVDLRPMFAAIAKLATIYLAGQISGTPTFQAHDVATVTGILVGGLDQMAQGRRPAGIPTMDLTDEQADQIGSALLARLPAAERARVGDRVGGLLRQGKVPAALAVVGPMLFQGDEAALTDLRRRLAGDQLDLGAPLARAHESAGVGLLHALHELGRWGTATLGALLAAMAVLAVLLAAQHARWRRGDTMLLVAGGMVVGGAAALLLGLLLPTLVGDPTAGIVGANPTLPLRVRDLLHDLQGTMIDRIRAGWEQVAAGVVLAGCLLGLVGLLVRRRRRPFNRRRSVILALSAAVLLSSSSLATPAHFGGEATSCNGSRALCALRYDKAVYAASHNAMASSTDDFVGATQDPDLVGQLDTGVRALLLDVQHWTTPTQVETFLARLRPRERDALEPLVRGARSTRPGLWLCHSVCQLGALSLDTALHAVDGWLARNPSEVVTLILQDSVPPGEVIAAFRRAGLVHRIVTPPADPHGRWPTLGHLVATDRRLVVFAENADVPKSWYRRFFRYGADTPFDVPSPTWFTCRVGRGSRTAQILLVNHWVDGDDPGRTDADAVNREPVLLAHLRRCEQAGLTPTFLATDFTTIGDLVPTVATLNAQRSHSPR
ncbi:PI-PLC domain-containing protein [Frankia tisae]|uniref:PI-PLC domain-containing protein n=1 Tax=Frankia tisae TaxID=2950104 RepID=UPI0021C0EB4F|nr:PI-PLC domain-containing protein [Frankia tisae]